MKKILALLASLLAFSGVSAVAEEVRIIRDPWGVPHVFAESNHGAGYGYGWAIAEDRLEEALSAMWTANGLSLIHI